MDFKRGLVIFLIVLVIVFLALFLIMPEQLGYWAHKIISFITFGLI